MASKGQRSKLDHETRNRRQKTLEAPREPRRPKAHWDHVLEEMAWLSKDFESERKWKLAQAKKVALRASKGMLDQATREERKLKEEEQRLRKIALTITKDVKKFWIKVEKLEDDERTLEEDEAHISSRERLEELEALRNEVDLPIEELLKRYAAGRGSRETSPEDGKPEATFVGQNNASDKENAFCTANETETNNPIVRRSVSW